MELHNYLLGLSRAARNEFGHRCGTTAGRLMQVAYGNDPASAELCIAIDRESGGSVGYREVNAAWEKKRAPEDTRRRIPMDWSYLERKIASATMQVAAGERALHSVIDTSLAEGS